MVYIRNILLAHSNMSDDEEITVFFKSDTTLYINKTDMLETISGDLKITRYDRNSKITFIVDCAEIEMIRYGLKR